MGDRLAAGQPGGPGGGLQPAKFRASAEARIKLDAVWLAKLTEKGLLRPRFVPPRLIRVLRDYTRLRRDLTAEPEFGHSLSA